MQWLVPLLALFISAEAYGSAAPPSDPRRSRRDASFQSYCLVGTLHGPPGPSDPHTSNPFLCQSILPNPVACGKLRTARSISNWHRDKRARIAPTRRRVRAGHKCRSPHPTRQTFPQKRAPFSSQRVRKPIYGIRASRRSPRAKADEFIQSLPGRVFFLTPQSSDPLKPEVAGQIEYPLAKLVVFTEHKDTIRRGGVSSLIK